MAKQKQKRRLFKLNFAELKIQTIINPRLFHSSVKDLSNVTLLVLLALFFKKCNGTRMTKNIAIFSFAI